ncbi:MAG TPA: GNAT family N-acetyltransferase [Tepidisphaeraceae bacterium]|jgi:RimJ/RimL family protein N-acetyltransferase|nr:GNAT family N-acetyltransferase [Tepidisphaeraceae bacterium]
MDAFSASCVLLRDVADDDLDDFFEHQIDPVANHMAAFTRKNPSDREAFNAHWAKIRGNPDIVIKTIMFGDCVAGHIAVYGPPQEKEVTYWIGKDFTGRGLATEALSRFLGEFKSRPLFAHAAKDNLASIRVLEKNGFVISGHDRFFANARGEEIDEVIMKLG